MNQQTKIILIIGTLAVVSAFVLFFMSGASAPQKTDTASKTENLKPTPIPAGTPSPDLKIEEIKEGTGPAVKSGDTVVMHYNGTLTNGTKFDSSYDRGEPFETIIGVGAVIKGWDQGVPGMKVGGKRKLVIPADLAYGSRAAGSIPPNSTLIFEVELLEIKN